MLTKFKVQHVCFKYVCHYFIMLFFYFLFFAQPMMSISYNYANPINTKQVIDFITLSMSTVFAFCACLTMWLFFFLKACLECFESNKMLKSKKMEFKESCIDSEKNDFLLDFSNPFLYSNKTKKLRE